MHPVIHTFNVFMFSLFALLFINCMAMALGGYDAVGNTLMIDSPLQVLLGALIGLIPNCATSIFLALAYVKGIFSFPTLLAGLTSTTGIGLYALMKYNKNNGDNSLIMILLLLTAVGVGLFAYNTDLISVINGFIH